MDVNKLNEDLCVLVSKRNMLAAIGYNDDAYDEVEEALHDFEDEFLEKYEDYLEEGLQTVHDKYCPDMDVLLPISYIAKKYIEKADNEGNITYGVGANEGILIDVDKFPRSDVRLILVPTPVRVVMTINNTNPQIVWEAS